MAESRVRREIVAQHAEIRELLGEVEGLAKQFEQAAGEAPGLGTQLHDRGLVLYEKFGAHLDREQELLEPALRTAGAKGERLVIRMANEHHEQRELLKFLLARLRQHPEPTMMIARELQHFANFLRFEMSYEEKTMLTPEILGDGDR